MGFMPNMRRELSPRPMPISMRLPLCSASVAYMLPATDHSRTPGLVTSGPKIMSSVCAMHSAMVK